MSFKIPGEELLLSPFRLATRGEKEPLMGKSKTIVDEVVEEGISTLRCDKLAAVFAFFFIIAVGVAGCMYCEGWGPIASLYVITQMVTTVGYGDFTVTSDSMRIFMAFYGILCLVMLSYFINLYLQRVVDWQSNAIRGYLRRLEVYEDDEVDTEEAAAMKYGAFNRAVAAFVLFLSLVLFGTVFFRLYEHCSCADDADFLEEDHSGCRDPDFATCSATGGYVKTLPEAFYMSVITLTTIGFGDYQARTPVGRLVGSIWMLVGVVVAVNFVDALSAWFFEDASHGKFLEHDLVELLNEETFAKMDMKGDGQISRTEFMVYTLLKYGLVQEDVLSTIDKAFDRIASPKADHVTRAQIMLPDPVNRAKTHRLRRSVLF